MNPNGTKGTKGTPSTLEGTVNEIPRYEGNNRRRGDRRDIPGSRRANARASERSSSPRNERDTPMRNVHLEENLSTSVPPVGHPLDNSPPPNCN
ncbi:hypothetical protein HZH66_007702 [Vespula vulgaris]|uniref:Uncharacterized protein n=1 Tax=Vespula vulgaris TaxID=7454 RepID=A0A834JTF7_VESVU|nr:hypothetical protein HZH66_007702 [Vespula vulgaris]